MTETPEIKMWASRFERNIKGLSNEELCSLDPVSRPNHCKRNCGLCPFPQDVISSSRCHPEDFDGVGLAIHIIRKEKVVRQAEQHAKLGEEKAPTDLSTEQLQRIALREWKEVVIEKLTKLADEELGALNPEDSHNHCAKTACSKCPFPQSYAHDDQCHPEKLGCVFMALSVIGKEWHTRKRKALIIRRTHQIVDIEDVDADIISKINCT